MLWGGSWEMETVVARTVVVGVIPARGGSQRLPGKNIVPLEGKPLIAHVIEAARRARMLDRVIVSTDDPAISEVAARYGAEVIRRPDEIARHDSPIDDTYRHTIDYLERRERLAADVVVGMQANIAVRRDGEIDEVVRELLAVPWATAVATARLVSERPEWMKRLKDAATREIVPLVHADTNYRKQDLPELYLLDGAVIAMRSRVLRETAGDRRTHAYLGGRVLVHVHARPFGLEVEDPEDVDLVECLLSRFG